MTLPEELRARIVASANASSRSHLDCELAIFLVRAGQFDEAQQIYDRYHGDVAFGRDAALAIRLIVLDAILRFYRDGDVVYSRRRLSGAHVLAKSLRSPELLGFAAAWLCHILFNSAIYHAMSGVLSDALDNFESLDSSTKARVSLTTADMWALVGDFKQSLVWYAKAKSSADACGDYLYVSAMLHNRSAMAISHCRFASCFDRAPNAYAINFLSEIESVVAYEAYRAIGNVLNPNEIWLARRLMLLGRWRESAPIIERMLEAGATTRASIYYPHVLADLAMCKHLSGDQQSAVSIFQDAASAEPERAFADEIAVFFRYGLMINANMDPVSWAEYQSKAASFCARFSDEQAQIRQLLVAVGLHGAN